jgi:hypothetical protein
MPTPLTGQVAISGTAQPLSATTIPANAYTIKAPASNAHSVYLGAASVTASNGFVLSPGDELVYERRNQVGSPSYQLQVSDFYVLGTSGDVVAWLASP